MSSDRRARGFTLIEALVALTIAAGAVLALAEGLGLTGRLADRADGLRAAVRAAQSTLDRIGVDVAARPGRTAVDRDGVGVVLSIAAVSDEDHHGWRLAEAVIEARSPTGAPAVRLETFVLIAPERDQ